MLPKFLGFRGSLGLGGFLGPGAVYGLGLTGTRQFLCFLVALGHGPHSEMGPGNLRNCHGLDLPLVMIFLFGMSTMEA